MADIGSAARSEAALTFIVSAGLVYEVVAAACSSPQTTEINADTRADTLMKWVHLGLLQSALFVGITAAISSQPKAAIAGGGLAAVLMYGSYFYAKQCGLSSNAPGTESH
jgi:hypothetical protein